MPVTDGEDEFVMKTEDVGSTCVEMQCMIESVLYAFRETTLDRRIEAVVETNVVR